MNTIGFIAGLATFAGIWLGHVAVRRIEFVSRTIWLPSLAFAILGVVFEWFSLLAIDPHLSIVFGILGIIFLWDAFEFTRQQRRVIKGHTPTNPANPRHAKIQIEHISATPLDLVKRDPVGRLVNADEAIYLIKHQ